MNYLQRIFYLFILLLLVIRPLSAQVLLSPSKVGAKAFIVVDSNSSRVLSHYQATERLSPASITKLMTAYVTYQALDTGLLNQSDKVTISKNVYNMTEGSRMFLEAGSRVSINELLHGLVIQSGNDAAVALAEAVAGSEAAFIKLMNHAAKQLGMDNSHFKNVTGLTESGHFMSAQDIAILAQAIITQFPEHYKLYKEKSFTWNKITQNNRNSLLLDNTAVDGFKTGYTEDAGYCLVASAKRGDRRLISVVLGTKSVRDRIRASRQLLAFGFDHFVERTLVKKGQKIAHAVVKNGLSKVSIMAKEMIRLPISKHNKMKIEAKLVLDKPLEAPIEKGQVVGYIAIKQGKTILAKTPALTTNMVKKVGFFQHLWNRLFD
ncbi:MAG: D-alanyl-D-alanine carboxypeptidase family protein [Ostreibacterium sp.]